MKPSKVICAEEFIKKYDRLPSSVQLLCDIQIERLGRDTHDPRLQSKKLKGYDGVCSFRVTRAYRGLFYVNHEHTVVVFTIGHRKDIYR